MQYQQQICMDSTIYACNTNSLGVYMSEDGLVESVQVRPYVGTVNVINRAYRGGPSIKR